jgi:hypothetical protein
MRMNHIINASELATVCEELGLVEYRRALEVAAQAAAEAVAAKLGVVVTMPAETIPGFADLCVGFGPTTPGQAVPEPLWWFDTESEWMELVGPERCEE